MGLVYVTDQNRMLRSRMLEVLSLVFSQEKHYLLVDNKNNNTIDKYSIELAGE